jgi:hypothetical protein
MVYIYILKFLCCLFFKATVVDPFVTLELIDFSPGCLAGDKSCTSPSSSSDKSPLVPPFTVVSTHTVKDNGLNPYWNCDFSFLLTYTLEELQVFSSLNSSSPNFSSFLLSHLDHIASLSLRVTVYDYERIGDNKLIGANVLPLNCIRDGYRFLFLLLLFIDLLYINC